MGFDDVVGLYGQAACFGGPRRLPVAAPENVPAGLYRGCRGLASSLVSQGPETYCRGRTAMCARPRASGGSSSPPAGILLIESM